MQLKEDFATHAQCYVIDSNFDEKANLIAATVIVRRGTLKLEDHFVCGTDEGRLRIMTDDRGRSVDYAYPGQAVRLSGGFKHQPEVGHPLYAVASHEEATFIANRIKTRREREYSLSLKEISDKAHDLKKRVHGLSPIEKGKLYSGDKTIMYEKLGLVEESDLEKYRGKLHIKREDLDLTQIAPEDIDAILE